MTCIYLYHLVSFIPRASNGHQLPSVARPWSRKGPPHCWTASANLGVRFYCCLDQLLPAPKFFFTESLRVNLKLGCTPIDCEFNGEKDDSFSSGYNAYPIFRDPYPTIGFSARFGSIWIVWEPSIEFLGQKLAMVRGSNPAIIWPCRWQRFPSYLNDAPPGFKGTKWNESDGPTAWSPNQGVLQGYKRPGI